MKLFHFYRSNDETGISGTGPVVEGVQFTNGWCALRWISDKSSICFYQSIDEVKSIHSHGGKTEIIVHDFEPIKKNPDPLRNQRMEILMQVIEEASRAINLSEEGESFQTEIEEAITAVRQSIGQLESILLSNPSSQSGEGQVA